MSGVQGGTSSQAFRFVDLFAGIGGFHAALTALGGQCVYASEIDRAAAKVYERNWHTPALGDIVDATTDRMDVPEHDVLVAGFPCQPFSKSGFQRGMEEARGTLFWNILRVLEERKPPLVLLENVRNLAGPRHEHTWQVIVTSLRQLGYRVSSRPAVFSPHLLPPQRGGRPQVRERVFIAATYVGTQASGEDVRPIVTNKPVEGWDKHRWDVAQHLLREDDERPHARYDLSPAEKRWISTWDEFVALLRKREDFQKMPGFPIWADEFRSRAEVEELLAGGHLPAWKAAFLRKNAALYEENRPRIDAWLRKHDYLREFPTSRRKLEWQAQDAGSLSETVIHFRPSGIRAKKPTYLPALVAITQTSVLASEGRRITTTEARRLQGLPEWFDFGDQRDSVTYKQLGNGVNVGVVYHVMREQVARDHAVLRERSPHLVEAVLKSPESPDPGPVVMDEHLVVHLDGVLPLK